MKREKEKPVSEWPAVDFATRLHDCLFMLQVHGALTEAEGVKVKRRIRRIVEDRRKEKREGTR